MMGLNGLTISQSTDGEKVIVTIDNCEISVTPNLTAQAWEIYKDHKTLRHICKHINNEYNWVDNVYDIIVEGRDKTYNIILLVSCLLCIHHKKSGKQLQ